MKLQRLIVFVFIVAILAACNVQNSTPRPVQVEPQETLAVTDTPTATPTATPPAQQQVITLQMDVDYPSDSYWEPQTAPNLWTNIDPAKMDVYYENWVVDYAYALDGSLWIVGDVGVVHQLVSGEQILYSMQTGFPLNALSSVAISPTGDVWVGGENYTLFRFDGSTWHDEGATLPVPKYSRGWVCQSQDISGIDFDQDGNTWLMSGGIDLFAQAFGGWVIVPFPKELLSAAGGGGCPIGFSVVSQNDITIELEGCCMNEPIGYHFDGETWTEYVDYSVVDQELSKRHHGDTEKGFYLDEFRGTLRLSAWPVADEYFLPDVHFGFVDNELISDDQGNVGIYDGSRFFSNRNGKFTSTDLMGIIPDLSGEDDHLLDFTRVIYSVRSGQPPERILSSRDHQLDQAGNTYSVDDQNNIWYYKPNEGLYKFVNGNKNFIAKNDHLQPDDTGGTLALADGSILVGGRGTIWQYVEGAWSQWIIPGSNEVITFLRESPDGMVYAATNTGVFSIRDGLVTPVVFEEQDSLPLVVSNTGELADCSPSENMRYRYVTFCVYGFDYSVGQHFTVKYLHQNSDDSLIYVNNHIIARLKDGQWKSFYFDLLDIESATVDSNGNLWIYAGSNGLFRFSPDVFDDYVALVVPQ